MTMVFGRDASGYSEIEIARKAIVRAMLLHHGPDLSWLAAAPMA